MKKIFYILLISLFFINLSYAQEKIEILDDNIIGQDTLYINFTNSKPKKFIASIYWSPLSSQLPVGEQYNPWIWDDTRKYFIFSTFEGDNVYLPDYLPEYKKYVSEDKTMWMIPEKQALYLVDINGETITQILEIGPKEIHALNQKFYKKDGNIYFHANKDYLINLQSRTCQEAEAQAKRAIYIPKNLDECFVELKKIFSKDELAEIKDSKEEDMIKFHFGLGMWIRNNWIRETDSPLKKYFNEMGIFHPDDMSGIIFTSFHRHLHNKEIKLEEQIQYYKDYWKEIHKKEFYKYYSELLEYRKRPEVRLSSITSDYNNCEAFRKIVERGKLYLPFIIEEIKKGDFFLNQAMYEITGFDIRTTSEAKEVMGEQDISKLWIKWWGENKDKY